VKVRRVADAGDHRAPLGQRHLHSELVVVAVQVVDVLRDDLALEVLPGALADAVAGIDRGLAARLLGAQVRPPGLAAGAGGIRQGLALAIRALEAAEIRALAGSRAGDEE